MSNTDADHIGGFLDVFDAFPVETVFVSGDTNSTLTYNTFLRGVCDEGAETEVLRAGMLMDWGGVRANVISPPTGLEGGLFSEINDNSVAILLTHGTARIFPPRVAVIQCGADNPYGHPTPETLDKLHRVGANVFRNDEDGDVIATIKDQELKVAVTKR